MTQMKPPPENPGRFISLQRMPNGFSFGMKVRIPGFDFFHLGGGMKDLVRLINGCDKRYDIVHRDKLL